MLLCLLLYVFSPHLCGNRVIPYVWVWVQLHGFVIQYHTMRVCRQRCRSKFASWTWLSCYSYIENHSLQIRGAKQLKYGAHTVTIMFDDYIRVSKQWTDTHTHTQKTIGINSIFALSSFSFALSISLSLFNRPPSNSSILLLSPWYNVCAVLAFQYNYGQRIATNSTAGHTALRIQTVAHCLDCTLGTEKRVKERKQKRKSWKKEREREKKSPQKKNMLSLWCCRRLMPDIDNISILCRALVFDRHVHRLNLFNAVAEWKSFHSYHSCTWIFSCC